MCATPDGATDDTKKTRRPHGALSIIAKRRLRKPKTGKLTMSQIATGDNGAIEPKSTRAKTKETSRQSFKDRF
uniref:Uncharacterized protein n=1 Tax=Brassica campestris TaxID=3711 RepID=A0A3P6B5G6_BRACM|nr:unnamed protein product [Brassica rapa]